MNDTAKSVPLYTIALYALWVWVLISLAACWVLPATGHTDLGRGFGFTACVSASVAVAATGRYNATRVCRLMRVLNGIESPRAPDLHRVP